MIFTQVINETNRKLEKLPTEQASEKETTEIYGEDIRNRQQRIEEKIEHMHKVMVDQFINTRACQENCRQNRQDKTNQKIRAFSNDLSELEGKILQYHQNNAKTHYIIDKVNINKGEGKTEVDTVDCVEAFLPEISDKTRSYWHKVQPEVRITLNKLEFENKNVVQVLHKERERTFTSRILQINESGDHMVIHTTVTENKCIKASGVKVKMKTEKKWEKLDEEISGVPVYNILPEEHYVENVEGEQEWLSSRTKTETQEKCVRLRSEAYHLITCDSLKQNLSAVGLCGKATKNGDVIIKYVTAYKYPNSELGKLINKQAHIEIKVKEDMVEYVMGDDQCTIIETDILRPYIKIGLRGTFLQDTGNTEVGMKIIKYIDSENKVEIAFDDDSKVKKKISLASLNLTGLLESSLSLSKFNENVNVSNILESVAPILRCSKGSINENHVGSKIFITMKGRKKQLCARVLTCTSDEVSLSFPFPDKDENIKTNRALYVFKNNAHEDTVNDISLRRHINEENNDDMQIGCQYKLKFLKISSKNKIQLVGKVLESDNKGWKMAFMSPAGNNYVCEIPKNPEAYDFLGFVDSSEQYKNDKEAMKILIKSKHFPPCSGTDLHIEANPTRSNKYISVGLEECLNDSLITAQLHCISKVKLICSNTYNFEVEDENGVQLTFPKRAFNIYLVFEMEEKSNSNSENISVSGMKVESKKRKIMTLEDDSNRKKQSKEKETEKNKKEKKSKKEKKEKKQKKEKKEKK